MKKLSPIHATKFDINHKILDWIYSRENNFQKIQDYVEELVPIEPISN